MREPIASENLSDNRSLAGDSGGQDTPANGVKPTNGGVPADGAEPTDAVEAVDSAASEPAEITFDEQFYPARPKALRPIARRRQFFAARPSLEFDGRNPTYVDWLRNQSMLGDAKDRKSVV